MVSQKTDANWNEFVERMSAGLPVTASKSRENLLPKTGETSKNPFSPKSRFTSRQGTGHVENDGLQVVPPNSMAAQIWNQRLEPRPLAVPLRLSTGPGLRESRSVITPTSSRNPFTPRPEQSDAEGLQIVSPMTPGTSGWNPYPTPVSLPTPLTPWSGGTSTTCSGSNNPFSKPRYSDAEGLQAVVSNLGTGEQDGTLDAYAVMSSTHMSGRNTSLPYPLTPDLRNSQLSGRWGDTWTQILQQAYPPTSTTYLGNHQVQLPSSEVAELRGNSYPKSPNDEILIAVFGMTGTGKTTFIEKVSGQKLKIGHNLRSCAYPCSFRIPSSPSHF
jgi:hypothetical protein